MPMTKAQQMMAKDGLPKGLFFTPEQRKAAWEANPPKPMPAFGSQSRTLSAEAAKVLAEIEEQKKAKTKSRIHKMLVKKEDHTGQRWDGRKGRWITEESAMISITTNTRGAIKMKDYAEMSLVEMAAAYNKISGKPPIVKFKDKATGLKRLAEAKTAKAATPKTASAVKAPKENSTNKLAAEFGARVGSFREKLIIAFDESYRKLVPAGDLLKAVYGSKNTENTGALTMVIKGAQTMIEKSKLPYELKKEKNEGEISYGLWPKS